MKRILLLSIISVLTYQFTYSQQLESNKIHPFSGALLFSLNAGGTGTVSDYANFVADFQIESSAEYYFRLESKSALGLRAFGSIGKLSGSDPSKNIDKFYTGFVQAGVGVVYSYYLSPQFIPYIFGGLSRLWYSPKDANGALLPAGRINTLDQLDFKAEVGFHTQLTNDILLNASFGANFGDHDLLDGLKAGKANDYFFTASIGISYALFSNNNNDSDGDGVLDSGDRCPGTPPGVKVTSDGCPVDSDEDGVADYLDKCPGTPANVLVDRNGCPFDSDSDGVPDYLDTCSGTPAGTDVDQFGCPKKMEPEKPEVKKKVEPEKPLHIYDPSNETEIEKNIWSDGTQYVIQVSSWSNEGKAGKIAAQWRAEGHNAFVQKAYVNKFKRTYYRVRIGFFNSIKEAESYQKTLK